MAYFIFYSIILQVMLQYRSYVVFFLNIHRLLEAVTRTVVLDHRSDFLPFFRRRIVETFMGKR